MVSLDSLQPLLPFAIILAVVVVGAVGLYLRVKETRALKAFAAAHRLAYSTGDPGGIVDPAFGLFRQGVGRGCEDALTGLWQGLPVRAAHYSYYTESTDPKTKKTTRTTYHFTVLLAALDLRTPPITVTRLDWLGGILHDLGVHGIDFEAEAFNRRFQVACDDQAFAFKLIDPRMIEWLMGLGLESSLELRSGMLLVAVSQVVPAARLGAVFDAAAGFKDHVPRLVWREYGHRPPSIAAVSTAPGPPAGN